MSPLGLRQKGIKMQQPALRVFLFLAVVSAQPVANKNNSSSAIPFRQKRSSTSLHYLYCPTGEKSLALLASEMREGLVMEEFEDYCQCERDRDKSWKTDRSDYYCGSAKYNGIFTGFISSLLDWGYTEEIVEGACKIHDMCYETERNQDDCDKEFSYNFKQLCNGIDVDSWSVWSRSWADWILDTETDCESLANYGYEVVSELGSPRQTRKGREMMQCRGRL